MADVTASPNDPLFLNHHAMVDCILEEWLKRNLPTDLSDIENVYTTAGNNTGHRFTDYLVPFFPLYRNQDMFKTSDNFGYTCDLPNILSPADSGNTPNSKSGGWLLILSAIMASAVAQCIL